MTAAVESGEGAVRLGDAVGIFLKVFVLLLWFGICRGSESTVYTYSENDGSVSLSNVPTDRRYAVLVGSKGKEPQILAAVSGFRGGVGSTSRGLYAGVIDRVASLYGLESELLHAVIAVESGYNPVARSKKGASGLMQLMPETARRYGVADAFDPEQNIDAGARYLRDLLQMFEGNVSLVLAAYNAGENAVARNQNRIPPYRETLEYVPKVLAHYRKNQGL